MKTTTEIAAGLTRRQRDAIDTGSFTNDRWTRLICAQNTAQALRRRGLAEDRRNLGEFAPRWYLTFEGRQAYYLLHPELIEAAHAKAVALDKLCPVCQFGDPAKAHATPLGHPCAHRPVQTVTIAIEARGANGDWQRVAPAETINDPDPADVIAQACAANQNIAEGDDWRVRVWIGEDTEGPHVAEAGPASNLLLF